MFLHVFCKLHPPTHIVSQCFSRATFAKHCALQCGLQAIEHRGLPWFALFWVCCVADGFLGFACRALPVCWPGLLLFSGCAHDRNDFPNGCCHPQVPTWRFAMFPSGPIRQTLSSTMPPASSICQTSRFAMWLASRICQTSRFAMLPASSFCQTPRCSICAFSKPHLHNDTFCNVCSKRHLHNSLPYCHYRLIPSAHHGWWLPVLPRASAGSLFSRFC